jgi:two-component system LytT family response regulator
MKENKFIVVVVDNEEMDRHQLVEVLKLHDDMLISSEAGDAPTAWQKIIETKPDLVFMAHNLPKKDGFTLHDELKKANNNGFDVVFLTHNCEHAQKAMKQGAFDYLMKPVSTLELDKTLLKFRIKHDENQNAPSDAGKNHTQFSPLTIKKKILTEMGNVYLDPNEIVYLKVEEKKTLIILGHNLRYLACYSLKTVLEILGSPLLKKVHKSWGINESFLHRYDNTDKYCELMVDGEIIKIPVSRRGGTLLNG